MAVVLGAAAVMTVAEGPTATEPADHILWPTEWPSLVQEAPPGGQPRVLATLGYHREAVVRRLGAPDHRGTKDHNRGNWYYERQGHLIEIGWDAQGRVTALRRRTLTR